ncbi:MAG: regulatory protein RecX [Deltaproteobacteria bacterium]|nr:regulatory protein RecX [Deltaproteobacteria bacterium]
MSRAPVSAWWKAQELLARRAHGSQELRRKLKERNYPEAEVEAAMGRLRNAGLLDDAAFARSLVEELFFRRGYGINAIVMRLRQKGLAPELCESAGKQFFCELDQTEIDTVITRLIERRRAHEEDRNRLFAWLKRRGFRSDEIIRALQSRTS